MSDEATYGREPVTIVQLEQPRCSLRFGEAPCTATGTPKCYQTYWTCKDKANYTPDGYIRWRFMAGEAGIYPLYEEDGPNKISTNPLYMVESVSTTSTRINLGASREGESPFGTRAGVRVQMRDQQFDDHVGDFYLADRVDLPDRNFWTVWKARNPFYPGMILTVFEGYRGQALSAMQSRLYLVNRVIGPDGNGRVTIEGDDPLQLADRKRAMFPRATDIRLIGNIDATSLAVRVFGLEEDIDDAFGNTPTSYLRIGSEILGYTGRTDDGDGEWTLTGVSRGQRGTSADSHEDGEGCQRVGAFDRMLMFQVAEYLLKNHTQIDNSYINAGGQWDAEGGSFLSTFRTTATIPDPEPVENLVGELCRDGLFSIWWDERAKVIPLLAVRPPQETPAQINDDLNILADTASLTERPDDRMTRVSVFYGERNPLERDSPANYRNRRIRVDGEVESPEATDGTIRDVEIFSRWINTAGNAFLLAAQLLLRYRLPPQYVSLALDAKDRAIAVGDVLDVTTRVIRDIEGRPLETRWQVIASDEVKSGSLVQVELQSYQFVGKFGIIMPNDAPDYATATPEERLFGAWFADDATGLMPNGDEPYLFQ